MARRPILKPFFTGAFLASLVLSLMPRDREVEAAPLAIDRMHFASVRHASVFPRLAGAPPILAGFSGGGGAVISANMPDPYTPVDGTMNVTGAIDASSTINGTTITGSRVDSNIFQTTSGTTMTFRDFAQNVLATLSDEGTTGKLTLAQLTIGDSTVNSGGSIYGNSDSNDFMLLSANDNGAAAVAVTLGAYDDYTTSGAKLLSVGDNAGTSYAEQASIDLNGTYLNTYARIGRNTGVGANGVWADDYYPLTTDGNIEFRDSGANLLATLADNGTTGTFSSTGAAGSGGTVNGVEIDYSTADTLATDTTPVSVTGISLAIDANDTYAIICQGTVFTALATAGPQMGLDLPASATQVATCATGTTASAAQYLSFTADDGSCANLNGLTTPGTPFTLYSKVTNSTNAGNVVLRIRSETTDDVTVVAGARCEAKKIVDS